MTTNRIDAGSFYINILKHNCRSRLEDFRTYVFEIERKFQDDMAEIAEKHKASANEEDEETRSYLADTYSEEHYQIDKVFRKILRYSVLVALYTLLEDTLVSICEKFELHKTLKPTFQDFKKMNKGLTTIAIAKMYLINVASIQLSPIDNIWGDLEKLNIIRNCIVHSEGNSCKGPKKRIQDAVKNTSDVTLENDRYIVLSEVYIARTIDCIGSYLNGIITASYTSKK